MKKVILLITLTVMTLGSYAQTMKVQSAFADFTADRFGKAKQNIDEACQNEQTKNEAKTWFYAGLIYVKLLDIATSTEEDGKTRNARDEKLFKKQKINDPIDTLAERAKNSLVNALKLEKATGTHEYTESTAKNLDFISQYYINKCVTFYNAQNFSEAIKIGEEIVNMGNLSKTALAAVFTSKAKFIMANAYYYNKNNEKANELYRDLIKLKTTESDAYIKIYAANLGANDTTKAINTLKAGIKNIPDTMTGNFLVKSVLAGLYLRMGNNEEGNKLVDELTAKTGNNPNKLNTLAGELSGAGADEKAIELYNRSLQFEANQIGANYGLGLIHYNRAADFVSAGNKAVEAMNYDEANKFDAQAKEEFNTAIPYFQNVLKIDSKNFYTLQALITIYRKQNMMDKANELDAVFQTLLKK
jgi:Tfp pilus assembly protein PilF